MAFKRSAVRLRLAPPTGHPPRDFGHGSPADRSGREGSTGRATSRWAIIRSPKSRTLIAAIVANIDAGRAVEAPFFHLEFDRVFPDGVYADMIEQMPNAADYRPLKGRNGGNLREDGSSTRVKIDLFPEFIRHLPEPKAHDLGFGRACSYVGRRAGRVHAAARARTRAALRRRFTDVGMYPIPVLTRDIPGYRITPHTDTQWKGITVQLYLPRDNANTNIGTIFHDRLADGSLPKATQMKFARNSGYAFAVGDNTWHSADPVGTEVTTRDSILLTYFVDSGLLRFLRNRAKRVGNFLLSEAKHVVRK